MAVIHADGMPYTTVQTMFQSSSFYYGAGEVRTGGRFGGRYLYIGYGNAVYGTAWMYRNFTASYGPTIYFQCGFYPGLWGNNPLQFCLARDSGAMQFYIQDNAAGKIQVYNGANTLLGESAAGVLSLQQWQQIECKIVLDTGTSGTVDVKLNGNYVIQATGKKTANTANTTINSFGLNCGGSSGMNVCDIILFDNTGSYVNTWLGSRRVIPGWPTANGYYAQWTPSAGANWQTVDEIDPVETDYNSTSVVNNIDTFAIPDISNPNAVVDAVICTMYAKNGDAGFGKLKGAVRSNSLDGVGTEVQLADSGGFQESMIYVDPNTGNPFTVAGFNAAEFGYKRTA